LKFYNATSLVIKIQRPCKVAYSRIFTICIFYNCKNAVLCFLNVKDFSITHSIIYGAYEAAIWFGYGSDVNLPFTFHDNVIANGNYFWIGAKGIHQNYSFSNSVISGNTNYMGFNADPIEPDTLNKPVEKNIRKSGQAFLSEIAAKGIPRDYLNLSAHLQVKILMREFL